MPFDGLGEAGRLALESRERVVQSEQVLDRRRRRRRCHLDGLEVDIGLAAAALRGLPSAGVVDHDLAHGARGDREEVGAVVVRQVAALGDAQERLVHQRGRRRPGVARPAHVASGERAQIVVDDLEEFPRRCAVAVARRGEQARHGTGVGGRLGRGVEVGHFAAHCSARRNARVTESRSVAESRLPMRSLAKPPSNAVPASSPSSASWREPERRAALARSRPKTPRSPPTSSACWRSIGESLGPIEGLRGEVAGAAERQLLAGEIAEPPAARTARRLAAGREAGRGRDGRGLGRRACRGRLHPARGGEAGALRDGEPRGRRPLRRRAAAPRPPRASRDRPPARRRHRARRSALVRDGARRRAVGDALRRGSWPRRRRPTAPVPRDLRGRRLRAPLAGRASRSQAVEHPGDRRRATEAARLRSCQAPRAAARRRPGWRRCRRHAHRTARADPRLRRARADSRRTGHHDDRRLFAGSHPLRAADRRLASPPAVGQLGHHARCRCRARDDRTPVAAPAPPRLGEARRGLVCGNGSRAISTPSFSRRWRGSRSGAMSRWPRCRRISSPISPDGRSPPARIRPATASRSSSAGIDLPSRQQGSCWRPWSAA